MSELNATTSPRPGGTAPFAGRTVSRIGFGAMQLDRLKADRSAASRVVRRALELGVDHIDTSEYYGIANDVLRETLEEENDVMVVSKVGWETDPSGGRLPKLAQRPEQLRVSVEQNLQALGLEQIPVVNLRRPGTGHDLMTPDQEVDLDDQIAEMSAMRADGLIGAIGISTVTLDEFRRALPAGIACVQNAYSLVNRTDEPILEICLEEGIAWVPYFPLGSAFPGIPKVVDEPIVQSVADRLGVTAAQIGLAWLLHHAPHTLLIAGTSSTDHLEDNVAVGDIELDATIVAELESIPTRKPERQG